MIRLAAWSIALAALTSPAIAQSQHEPHASLKEGKSVYATRLTGTIKIDGHLDEQAWSSALPVIDFRQQEPANGEPMSEATAVQVMFDDRYLYVAVRCGQREPSAIASGLARRDALDDTTDEITVHVDPRHDHATGYAFQTNPSASQGEFAWYSDDMRDRDYDAVWDVRVARIAVGWTAEFRIPFSQMRFGGEPTGSTVWGFQVTRVIRRSGESGAWVSRPRGERGEVSHFGHLVFGEPLAPPRRQELVPYVLAGAAIGSGGARDPSMSAGADLRVGIGSSATLVVAVNPDFGQVEQDPAMLNLSVFERFLPEKRTFFLEDGTMFVPQGGEFQLFYSRRIDETLRGAVKVTGKSHGWTYGGVMALTRDAGFGVGRFQRDILSGSSKIGGLVTAVARARGTEGVAGGMDYNLRWDRGRVRWDGHWAITRAPVQARMTTSAGGATNVSVSRKHWQLFGHVDRFGRDFRIDDAGFNAARANRNYVRTGVVLMSPDPIMGFRSATGSAIVAQGWTRDRAVFDRYVQGYIELASRNYWRIGAVVKRRFGVLDDLDTRGGPPIAKPAYTYAGVMVGGDSRKQVTWHLDAGREMSDDDGVALHVTGGISAQLSDQLGMSAAASYDTAREAAQWIENRERTKGGIDHIYGALDRHAVDLTVRASYAFTRDLTVQAYLQPFVAVGDYSDIRRLARPDSREFEPASPSSDPDFSLTSLQGNVVLRWEYQPGSLLFVAWNHAQTGESQRGEFRAWRDLGAAFDGDRVTRLMVKASWRLGR